MNHMSDKQDHCLLLNNNQGVKQVSKSTVNGVVWIGDPPSFVPVSASGKVMETANSLGAKTQS